MVTGAHILRNQKEMYEGTFYRRHRWRWTFRDDCRYRQCRLIELLGQLCFSLHKRRVLDVGFGSGDLLFLFPTSCRLMGIELSADAVAAIRAEPRTRLYADAWFDTIRDDGSLPVPPEPTDILICSHVLEHVPDDRWLLQQMTTMLAPGGILVVFVPLEPPGFDPKHVRTYTVDSLASLVDSEGLDVLHLESNYQICWGPFRWMDHPARHSWPLLQQLEGIRNVLLTVVPFRTTRALEELLGQLGAPATQAMVVAQRH